MSLQHPATLPSRAAANLHSCLIWVILQAQQQSPPHGRTAEGALDGAAVLDVVIRKMITGEERPTPVGEAQVEHREQPRVYTGISGQIAAN